MGYIRAMLQTIQISASRDTTLCSLAYRETVKILWDSLLYLTIGGTPHRVALQTFLLSYLPSLMSADCALTRSLDVELTAQKVSNRRNWIATHRFGCDVLAPTNAEKKPIEPTTRKSLILLTSAGGSCGLRPVPRR
jgi:hypothetical protein